MIGMGIIVRDREGRTIATISEAKNYVTDPVVGEALAAREAVELGTLLGMRVIILEGDALEVVNTINQDEPSKGLYGQAINNIKNLMAQEGRWMTRHTGRSANVAAHVLAKLGLQHLAPQRWSSVLPDCVDAIVRAEQCL